MRVQRAISPSAELLLDVVPKIMQIISVEAQASAPTAGLTTTQLRVLGQLAQGRRLPSEIARDLRISPATVSEVVDLLARRGLVERGNDPDDRRVSVLSATPTGAEAWRSARARALSALEHLVSVLTTDEQSCLQAGLNSVRDLLGRDADTRREEANARR